MNLNLRLEQERICNIGRQFDEIRDIAKSITSEDIGAIRAKACELADPDGIEKLGDVSDEYIALLIVHRRLLAWHVEFMAEATRECCIALGKSILAGVPAYEECANTLKARVEEENETHFVPLAQLIEEALGVELAECGLELCEPRGIKHVTFDQSRLAFYIPDWKRYGTVLEGEDPDIFAEIIRVLPDDPNWLYTQNDRFGGLTPLHIIEKGQEFWVRDVLRSHVSIGSS